MTGIRAVLFDLDGTLADTAPDMARTVNVMRERAASPPVRARRWCGRTSPTARAA